MMATTEAPSASLIWQLVSPVSAGRCLYQKRLCSSNWRTRSSTICFPSTSSFINPAQCCVDCLALHRHTLRSEVVSAVASRIHPDRIHGKFDFVARKKWISSQRKNYDAADDRFFCGIKAFADRQPSPFITSWHNDNTLHRKPPSPENSLFHTWSDSYVSFLGISKLEQKWNIIWITEKLADDVLLKAESAVCSLYWCRKDLNAAAPSGFFSTRLELLFRTTPCKGMERSGSTIQFLWDNLLPVIFYWIDFWEVHSKVI